MRSGSRMPACGTSPVPRRALRASARQRRHAEPTASSGSRSVAQVGPPRHPAAGVGRPPTPGLPSKGRPPCSGFDERPGSRTADVGWASLAPSRRASAGGVEVAQPLVTVCPRRRDRAIAAGRSRVDSGREMLAHHRRASWAADRVHRPRRAVIREKGLGADASTGGLHPEARAAAHQRPASSQTVWSEAAR